MKSSRLFDGVLLFIAGVFTGGGLAIEEGDTTATTTSPQDLNIAANTEIQPASDLHGRNSISYENKTIQVGTNNEYTPDVLVYGPHLNSCPAFHAGDGAAAMDLGAASSQIHGDFHDVGSGSSHGTPKPSTSTTNGLLTNQPIVRTIDTTTPLVSTHARRHDGEEQAVAEKEDLIVDFSSIGDNVDPVLPSVDDDHTPVMDANEITSEEPSGGTIDERSTDNIVGRDISTPSITTTETAPSSASSADSKSMESCPPPDDIASKHSGMTTTPPDDDVKESEASVEKQASGAITYGFTKQLAELLAGEVIEIDSTGAMLPEDPKAMLYSKAVTKVPIPVRATLGPRDTPLRNGEYLSCGCTSNANGSASDNIAHIAAPAFLPPSGREGVCIYPTDDRSMRVTRGFEPNDSAEPLAEFGGGSRTVSKARRRAGDAWSWIKRKISRAATTRTAESTLSASETSRHQDDERATSGTRTEVWVGKGCVSVVGVTPAKQGGGFLAYARKEKRRVVYRSPRPKGYWRVYVSFFDKIGRDICDAELIVHPDGRVTIETASGNVLWEVPLG